MTLANKITISRIALLPIMIIIISIPALHEIVVIDAFHNMNLAQLLFAIIFCIAAATDFLDGYIARKRNEITDFGKFLDPIADKMLVVTGFVYLVAIGQVDIFVLVIILLREFMVSGIRLLAVKRNEVIAASWWGKIKTFTTMVVLIFMLFNQFGINAFDGTNPLLVSLPDTNIEAYFSMNGYLNIGRILTWVCAAITVLSGVDYFLKSKKIILEDAKGNTKKEKK